MEKEKETIAPRKVKFKDAKLRPLATEPGETTTVEVALVENKTTRTPPSRPAQKKDAATTEQQGYSSTRDRAIDVSSQSDFWLCKRCKYKNADRTGQFCALCGLNRFVRKTPKTERPSLTTDQPRGKPKDDKSLSPQAEKAFASLLGGGESSSDDSDSESLGALASAPPLRRSPRQKLSDIPPVVSSTSFASVDSGATTVVASNTHQLAGTSSKKKRPDRLLNYGLHHTLNITEYDDMVAPEPPVPEATTTDQAVGNFSYQYPKRPATSPRRSPWGVAPVIWGVVLALLATAFVVMALLLQGNDSDSKTPSPPQLTFSPSAAPQTNEPASVSPTTAPSSAQLTFSPTAAPQTKQPISVSPTTALPPLPSTVTLVPVNGAIRGVNSSKFGRALYLNDSGDIIAVGAHDALNMEGNMVGKVQIFFFYPRENSWVQLGQDLEGIYDGDLFGTAVSLSQDGFTVAIGAPGYSHGYVATFRYDIEDNVWTPRGHEVIWGAPKDGFGLTISLSGNGEVVAVGSRKSTQVYRFGPEASSWIRMGKGIRSGGKHDKGWMVSLSSSGLTLAVGVPQKGQKTPSVAQVYDFDEDRKDWTMRGQINGTSIVGSEIDFARPPTVSLSGDGNTVAVHATDDDGIALAGVFVYSRSESVFAQLGQSIAVDVERISGGGSIDVSTQSISLSRNGRVLAVNVAGVPLVFWYDSSVDLWKMLIENFVVFGNSLTLSGNGEFVAVGNEVSSQVDVFHLE